MLQDRKQLSAAGGIWSYWEKAQWWLPWPSPPPPASGLLWLHGIQKQGFISLSPSSPLSLSAFPPVPACVVYHPSRTWAEYLLNKYRLWKSQSSLCVLFCLTLPTWVFVLFQNTAMADRFDCDNCKESLYGRKYIQSDNSPYCIPCYDSLFSNTCDECKELIGHDARVRGISTWPDMQPAELKHY